MTDSLGRVVVFSDIQGSIDKLDRFVNVANAMRKDAVLCLGDIIHRGNDYADNRCLDLVRENATYTVQGNHEDHTPNAQKISVQNKEWVDSLPAMIDFGNALAYHSSQHSPGLRLRSGEELAKEGAYVAEHHPHVRVCLFGHSHEMFAAYWRKGVVKVSSEKEQELPKDNLVLMNPGTLGAKNMKSTFAYLDFGRSRLRFFELGEAEQMVRRKRIVDTFDERWMPALAGQGGWFTAYAQEDVPKLEEINDSAVFPVVRALDSIKTGLAKHSDSNGKKYLLESSLALAKTISALRGTIDDYFESKDPMQSRREYLATPIKEY